MLLVMSAQGVLRLARRGYLGDDVEEGGGDRRGAHAGDRRRQVARFNPIRTQRAQSATWGQKNRKKIRPTAGLRGTVG